MNAKGAMMMKQEDVIRGQFTFYASYLEAVEQLPKSRRLETLQGLIRYGLYGEEPTALQGASLSVFRAVRPHLASGRTKAANRLARRQAELSGFDPDADAPGGAM